MSIAQKNKRKHGRRATPIKIQESESDFYEVTFFFYFANSSSIIGSCLTAAPVSADSPSLPECSLDRRRHNPSSDFLYLYSPAPNSSFSHFRTTGKKKKKRFTSELNCSFSAKTTSVCILRKHRCEFNPLPLCAVRTSLMCKKSLASKDMAMPCTGTSSLGPGL